MYIHVHTCNLFQIQIQIQTPIHWGPPALPVHCNTGALPSRRGAKSQWDGAEEPKRLVAGVRNNVYRRVKLTVKW